MRDILRAQLRLDEGVRDKPYVDSVGKLTIGVGHNLTDLGLSDAVVNMILDEDMDDAERAARKLIPNFDRLTLERQAVVCNMAFNLGETRLAGFKNTLRAINEGRWEDAASGMLDSLWAKQVGQRAIRLAAKMISG